MRVSPFELHVNDPEFFGEIYAGVNRPRDKFEPHMRGSTSQLSLAFTSEHARHRLRREPLHHYFSRRSIASLQPLITSKTNRLCERLDEYREAERPINLSVAFVALTVDIISQCCYADSFDYLEEDDFAPEWRETVIRRTKSMKFVGHFPSIPMLLPYLPKKILVALTGDVSLAVEHKMVSYITPINLLHCCQRSWLILMAQRIRAQIQRLLDKSTSASEIAPMTIFQDLLESNALPSDEKGLDRLTDEGAILLAAGSETVAKTLGIISVHLMLQPQIVERLRAELTKLMPRPNMDASWLDLEKLPYLTAVIKEGLRLHHGLAGRNPRVAPHEDLQFKEWLIPAGTPVSSLPALIHLNPDIFHDPRAFLPERWLDRGEFRKGADKFMFSFGRGSRACLGINLAYAELFITLAAIVRRFDFIPYRTDIRDVDLERDFIIPTPKLGSLGVRAMVSRKLSA